MHFLLLLALIIVCVPYFWVEPAFPWGVTGGCLATALAVAAVWGTAAWIAHRFAMRIARNPGGVVGWMRAYSAWRFWHGLALLLSYAACMGLFGWGWSVGRICTVTGPEGEYLLPGAELLVLSPFFLMLTGAWWAFHSVEAAAHRAVAPAGDDRPMIGRPRYVLFHLRQYALILLLPLTILLLRQGLDRTFPAWLDGSAARLGMLAVIIAAVLAFPLSLPPLLGLKPMRPGPRRDRLESVARSVRLRYRDLLVWDTHGGVFNAMVIGFVPPARYIIFTDRLLDDLNEEQLDAVFGHEAGHVKHGHLLFYGCFLLLSVFAFSAAWTASTPWLMRNFGGWAVANQEWLQGGQVTAMLTYFFVVFGFLSRRCERQADVFGCRVASRADGRLTPEGVATFITALRMAERPGGSGDQSGPAARPRRGLVRRVFAWLRAWTHSTPERRAAFLSRLAERPELERTFQRRLARVKWGVILLLAGTVVTLGFLFGWDVLLQAL